MDQIGLEKCACGLRPTLADTAGLDSLSTLSVLKWRARTSRDVPDQEHPNEFKNTRTSQIARVEARNELHPINCSHRAGFDMHSGDDRRRENEQANDPESSRAKRLYCPFRRRFRRKKFTR